MSEHETNMVLMFFLGVCITAFIMGLFCLGQKSYKVVLVNIPDRATINTFCKDIGYQMGWLDSHNCTENQVMCYKKVGELSQYKCEEFR